MTKKILLSLALILLLSVPMFATTSYTISAINKDQEGTTGDVIEKPFIVKVVDQKGNPVAGMRVESYCENAIKKAAVKDPLVYTDKNGIAKIMFKNGGNIAFYKIVTKVFAPQGYKPLKVLKFTSMAINIRIILFYVFGGLALFLFGMKLLSDGLQSSSGSKMKSILGFLSKNKYMGILLGFVVTSILQSSSVTTVMLIGFVNAGIMTFAQTIGVILGANIGTTVTAFIISLKASQIAFPILVVGFLMNLLSKNSRTKFMGQVFLGLGLVFIGLMTMKSHVQPLKDSITISHFFVTFSTNTFLAIIAGMSVTFLIQSSSATLGLIITLGAAGLIDIQGALGLILGSNIGTTITAQIAAFSASVAAKRVAVMHSVFNIVGALIMYMLIKVGLIKYFYSLTTSIINIFNSDNLTIIKTNRGLTIPALSMPIFIAFSHATFNIINTLIFLPFTNFFAKVITKIIPDRKEKGKFEYLEPHLLNTPSIALAQTTHELNYMLETAEKMIGSAAASIRKSKDGKSKNFLKREKRVDNMQLNLTEYLVRLTQQHQLTDDEYDTIPKLIHAINDIERIGDLTENIVENAIEYHDCKIKFSDDALEQLNVMYELSDRMSKATRAAMIGFDKSKANIVLQIEDELNTYEEKLRNSHMSRLQGGSCQAVTGIYFLDIISNYERIGDHLTNIAKVIKGSQINAAIV